MEHLVSSAAFTKIIDRVNWHSHYLQPFSAVHSSKIIDLEGYFFFHSACPFPPSLSNMFKQYLEKELQKVFCVPLALLN